MAQIVNSAITDTWPFRDLSNALVTGKVNADFVAAAYLTTAPTTTAAVTVAGVTGQSGDYGATFTPSVIGRWKLRVTCVHNGYTYGPWTETFDVITPAQADPAAALAARSLAVASAVATNQTITLVRGDDYLNADARALSWSVSSPDLTGATVTLTIRTYAGATVLAKAMTVSGATVRVDLTAAETAALDLGTPKYKYEIVADLAGETTATLVTGTVWVTD